MTFISYMNENAVATKTLPIACLAVDFETKLIDNRAIDQVTNYLTKAYAVRRFKVQIVCNNYKYVYSGWPIVF